jgi:hypothetical protein
MPSPKGYNTDQMTKSSIIECLKKKIKELEAEISQLKIQIKKQSLLGTLSDKEKRMVIKVALNSTLISSVFHST